MEHIAWSKRTTALLILFVCIYDSLSEWTKDYSNDPRPVCPTDLDKKPLNNRIVGGTDAGRGTFPYAVGILIAISSSKELRTDVSFCAGTLITDVHILTAAHCLYRNQYLKDYLWVNVNDYDTNNRNETNNYIRKVQEIEIHPKYDDETFDNDIALLTIRNPIPLDEDVRAAILPPFGRSLDVGTICTVWGWGRTTYNGSRSSILQKVDLPITSREECQKHLLHNVTENMMCAGGKEGHDACLGDSGGTLLVRDGNVYSLAGIVSFGKGCAIKDVSGVYTNISRYTDWIYENTRSAACKPEILQ
uniref:limulus clotting factor C n=1 Tax=Hadrurus spadix TaxID=141984 RepID=A0A1W7R9I8_9SCOR